MEKLLKTALQRSFEIHAIYEPEGTGKYGDCYSAAVDVFSSGMTFRVYFKKLENDRIEIMHADRWFFG